MKRFSSVSEANPSARRATQSSTGLKCLRLAWLLPLLATSAPAQENTRQLEGNGVASKYLTPGQLDSWTFDGDKGETIVTHVKTREFDSILELTLKDGKTDKAVVPEVDDEGSESRFSIRLPETGQYSIRIHGFKFQGGGNYDLKVQRFQAQPITIGTPFTGAFNHDGKAYCYFSGAKERFLVPELKGSAPDSWQILDHKGREVRHWAGAARQEEEGEHTVVVSGRPDNRFTLLLRESNLQDLKADKAANGRLAQGEMDVWNIQAKAGDFWMLDVVKQGTLSARVVYAPLEKDRQKRLARPGEPPELNLLPVASQSGHLRFAVVFGREDRYQLHLVAGSSASYTLTMTAPTVPLEPAKETADNLPVGGVRFYSFQAAPGQLLHVDLASEQFVPLLRLHDPAGQSLEPQIDPDGLRSRMTHMALATGSYRVQVSSLGDGGGGDFRLKLDKEQLKMVAMGGRERGTLQPNISDFWAFEGKEGQTVILNARSSDCDTAISVRSPQGVELASATANNGDTDSLLSVKLPTTGRYTLAISSRRGAGAYTVRLIDGD